MFRSIGRFLLYALLILTPLIAYIYLYNVMMETKNGNTYRQLYLELPMLLGIMLLLYIPYKSLYKNALLAFIPIFSLYLVYDIFYYFLKRSARVSDFSNLFLVHDLSFLFLLGILFFIALITIPIALLLLAFKEKGYRFYKTLLGLKILMVVIFSVEYLRPNNFLMQHFHYIDYSQAKTIKYNGRFASFFYYNAISRLSEKRVRAYQHASIDIDKRLFHDQNLSQKPNIHIIVLESFVDPRLFKEITYNRTPLADELAKYLGDRGFSYLKSPAYGGGTAQAELEVLTGIRALSKIDSVDFNTLKGEPISGFTQALKSQGYRTYGSIATTSEYFNSIAAYGSIGIDAIEFLEEVEAFKKSKGDKHIFDGDLFAYNLQRLKQLPTDRPYLFYTLGMYGHIPYDRNGALRPSIIFPSTKDHRIKRIANQFYYRTKALGEYLDALLQHDPHALIYITSDHLPSILNRGIGYAYEKEINSAMLLIGGKNSEIGVDAFYQVPRYLWHYLSDSPLEFQKRYSYEEEEHIYFKMLAESLQKEED
jgi:phosphoglycerol transferase MdoB-like AlkP superfamily enzyme